MFLPLIIQNYFVWHYGRAWSEFWGIWTTYLWFVTHIFSIPQLLRSLFAPFKRITQSRGQTFSGEDLAAYVIINLLSRLIGAMARTAIILTGLVVWLVTFVAGVLIYACWAFLPFLVVSLLGASLSLFFISI